MIRIKGFGIYTFVIIAFLALFTACSGDDPDFPGLEENPEETLTGVQSEIAKIKEAWEQNKVISDYYSMEGTGWFISFSDGKRIEIKNSEAILDIIRDEETVTIFTADGKSYTFMLEYQIPHFIIKTPQTITSKDVWTEGCNIQITNSQDYSIIYEDVQMKGRGNSTWDQPKKPYAIKLDKKSEVLGFPKHKRWVLLANYFDKTHIRTEVAFTLSRMSATAVEPGMTYTPRTSYVTMTMNGKYQGLYQLTEQLKIDENRVNVGDDGFLLEIDYRAYEDPENIIFRVSHIPQPIVIKDPDVEKSDENYNYVKEYLEMIDNILFSDNFMDGAEGYRKYIDINSFIDWFLVNEITKNNDATYYTSCYMNLSRGGKLQMGPVWDFDLSLANYPSWWTPNVSNINSAEGFLLKNVSWYARMLKDPLFVSTLKDRFKYYYENREQVYFEIDKQRLRIMSALKDNERQWKVYTNPYDENKLLQMHQDECEAMKNWLERRFNWLQSEINKL